MQHRSQAQGGARASSSGCRVVERRCGGRGTGATKRARGQRARGSRPPDPTKGPYRWKASRIEGSVALYGAAWRAVSATLSPKGPASAPKRSQADYSKEAARAKARETEGKRGKRQGCQRLGPIGHRGKKNAHARDSRSVTTSTRDAPEVESVFDTIRRSGPNVVKRSFPRSCCAEPETPRSVHAAKVARESRECARCGCSQSFEWQTSVGHIAGFSHLQVERSGGERKGTSWTEARSSSDEGHGRAEGETVCGCAFLNSPAHSTCRLRFASS